MNFLKGDRVVLLIESALSPEFKKGITYVVNEVNGEFIYVLSGINCCLGMSRFVLEYEFVKDKEKAIKEVNIKDLNVPTNVTITLPNSDLSVVEWFIKHKISTSVSPLDVSIDIAFSRTI
jgi:hypothetical protein